jgi:hypothetical protein
VITTIPRGAGRAATPDKYLALALTLVLLRGQPAVAEVKLTPFATVDLQHNSNLFALSPAEYSKVTQPGDTTTEYIVGMSNLFSWGLDKVTLNAEGRRFEYDAHSSVNHYEYAASGTANLQFTPIVGAVVFYTQTRNVLPFADALSPQLNLDTERAGEARLQVLLTPVWRFDLFPQWHESDTPLPRYPEFHLHEAGGGLGMNYLGIAKVTAGLELNYASGIYSGITAATKYNQETAQLTALYRVTGFSDFSGRLGYTTRDSQFNPGGSVVLASGANIVGDTAGQVGKTSTVTGNISYTRQLTSKTTVALAAFRNIESYVAGANSEVGTGANVDVRWSPDSKFTFDLTGGYEHDAIEGGLAIANAFDRSDRIKFVKLDLKYAVLSWLEVHPHVSYQDRASSLAIANYSSTVVGIKVIGRLE